MRDHRVDVSINVAPDERIEPVPIEPRDFRILLLGDFSGRGDDAPLGNEAPRRVDRDDLDLALARIAPRLRVSGDGAPDGAPLDLAFTTMDDFHPDRLLARVSAIHAAPRAPASESPPATPASSPSRPPAPDIATVLSGTSLLDDMLDATDDTAGGSSARPAARRDELAAFVEQAVAPHVVRPRDAQAVAHEEAGEREATRLLRLVLHHPRVQALEAAWRSVEMLTRRLDTDGGLDLFILDVPRDHVAAALDRLARERDAARGAADESWALAVALHTFPDGDAGAEALAQVAIAAGALDVACVAAAPATFAGYESATRLVDGETAPAAPPDVYTLIRRSRESRHLGLVFPRVLLRTPYGPENPADSIAFEEIEDPGRRDDYLWGSGAALVALLVGEAFLERGWSIGQRLSLDVGGLPLFTYRRGPETVALPCAEIVMSERVATHLLSSGLMPLAWIKGTDRVRLVDLRSVADPAAPLAGAWSGSTSPSARAT